MFKRWLGDVGGVWVIVGCVLGVILTLCVLKYQKRFSAEKIYIAPSSDVTIGKVRGIEENEEI